MTQNIVIWWLTVQGFGLAGLPLTRYLFRALPDRGYAFSKSFGLLLAGYLAWLLAMLGLAPFGRTLVIACALAVGALGLWLARAPRTTTGVKGETASARPQFSLFGYRLALPRSWRLVLAYEAIFLVAWLALLWMRGYDYQILISPNPYGTERPMDYAFFNAIRSSADFPPHDPWMAGFSINYYYFGYLLMAAVSLASGVGAGLAYNLALALIFALTALGVAGLVFNLIVLTDQERRASDQPQPARSILGGALAVALSIVLVLGAGNQGGALEVITGTADALSMHSSDLGRAVLNGLGPRAPLQLEQPYLTWGAQATTSAITPTNKLADFDWWSPSRALWDRSQQPGDPTKFYTITEFPFFSFWLGDMHPHVMALPFGLLALALALQTVARATAPNYGIGRRGWADLLLTAIILGSLYLINSWDLPTYLLLFLGALLLLYARLGKSQALPAGDRSLGIVAQAQSPLASVWWRHYLSQAATALLAAWILFAPFHLTFRSLVGGRGFPLGLVTGSRTPLHSFLIIFGLFLLPLLLYVVAIGRSVGDTARQPEHARDRERAAASAGLPNPLASTLSAWRYAPLVILGLLLLGLLIGFPLLALLPLAIYAAKLALDCADRPAAAYVLWGFALASLVCFGAEIVYLRDAFEGSSPRMNTIFKFYYQVWLIWGVLAGYALWWLLSAEKVKGERQKLKRPVRLTIYLLPFTVLLAGALVYPALTAGKLPRAATWAGIAGVTPREKTPAGAAGIAWLRANAPGNAVVLEAVGGAYDSGYSGLGFGQVSGSTGLATVLGWPSHEDQWRGGDPAARAQIEPRKADVATIYSSADTTQTAELLKKYHVDYIYIGAAERATYPAEGLAKLAQLGEVVFQQDDVVIYRVKK